MTFIIGVKSCSRVTNVTLNMERLVKDLGKGWWDLANRPRAFHVPCDLLCNWGQGQG